MWTARGVKSPDSPSGTPAPSDCAARLMAQTNCTPCFRISSRTPPRPSQTPTRSPDRWRDTPTSSATRLCAAFQQNLASDLLCDLRTTFAETLLPDLDQPEKLADFADMLAQTLVYGLFAARCYHTAETNPSLAPHAAHEIPLTNPFLRGLFDTLTGAELDHEPFMPFVDDLVELLAQANMTHILNTFSARAQREDPVVHFYETFLKAFDPKQREQRGVYYTPDPIVGYLTRAVHSPAAATLRAARRAGVPRGR
jgi:hypothetical protein